MSALTPPAASSAASSAAVPATPGAKPAGYEFKAVGLLALGCGMVGLDRFIISPLFPVMAKDLALSYSDFGLISGVLSLTWGLSALFAGGLADRLGPKRVLVPAMVLFSLLVGLTGLATGLASLLLLRGLMGIAEGAFMPASFASTVDASAPHRVGLNLGIFQMALGLFGLGLGPVIATQALTVLPSWRGVFVIVAVPGLLLAVLLQFTLRPLPGNAAGAASKRQAPSMLARATASLQVLRVRNVFCAMLSMTCWLSANIVFAAFLANYLTDFLKLDMQSMGFVLSAIGLGALLGMVGLSALSDRFGSRPVLIGAGVGILPLLWLFQHTGPESGVLFGLLACWALLNTGAVAVTIGRLTVDAVSSDRAATATGVVMGISEIVGGAVAPALAGVAAQAYGIEIILPITMGASLLGLLVAIFGIRGTGRRAAAAAAPVGLHTP
jgi:predicted MFS family arabinose efflux permease